VKRGLWVSASGQPPCAVRFESYTDIDDTGAEHEVSIISGDLTVGGKTHWFLSHRRARTRDPVRFVATTGAPDRIEADVRFGPRNFVSGSWGTLAMDFTATNRATVRLEGPAGLDRTVKLVWKQKEFRDVIVELDKLAGTDFPRAITWNEIKRDLSRVLRAAGFKPTIIRSNRAVADNPDGWTTGELHNALTTYRRGERAPWYVHVFITSRFQEEDPVDDEETLGIMFDTDHGEGDLNAIPREGCAVFIDAHRAVYGGEGEATVEREILMTLIHEIGHTFNLLHSFESDKGRPDSPSIMNYPEEYDYGEAQYYEDFTFSFDRDELIHLHHHSAVVTEPGRADGEEFGRDIFREAPRRLRRSADEEVRRRSARTFETALREVRAKVREELELRVTLPKTRVLRSEPLVATVSIVNVGTEPVSFRTALDWAAGDVRLQVARQGTNDYETLHPPMRRCMRRGLRTLAPGEHVETAIPLMLTREGDPLGSTGVFEIRAMLQVRRGDKWVDLVSKAAQLVVAKPSNERELELARLYRTKDLKAYLLMPGAALRPAGREAANRLHEVALEQHSGRLATLALAREATSRFAVPERIPEAFRDPSYVRRAVATVAAAANNEATGVSGLERMARQTSMLIARRAGRLEALAAASPPRLETATMGRASAARTAHAASPRANGAMPSRANGAKKRRAKRRAPTVELEDRAKRKRRPKRTKAVR
jgi:hypothetical protein